MRNAFGSFSLSYQKHPEYGNGPGFTPNDIALVRHSVPSDPNVIPATVCKFTSSENHGTICGWGRTCGKMYSYVEY